jgi:hypothetical protein
MQQSKGHEILLVGDFNEPFGSNPEGMEKLAAEVQMVDLMSRRHSSIPPATYASGRTRLEYALSTIHVASALTRSGYEPFNERFHTDHRAYFLDFDTARLFGRPTQQLSAHTRRVLNTANTVKATQYLKLKYDMLCAHNVFEQAKRLDQPGNRHEFAERLDKDIVDASLAAENRLKRVHEPAWSVALVQARQLVTILKKCNSMMRTGLDHSRKIQRNLEKSDDNTFVAPKTRHHECNQQRLRGAQQVVAEIIKTSFERQDKERNRRIQELEASIVRGAKDQATRLRRLRKAEAIKRLFAKLQYLRNPQARQGITSIEMPVHQDADPRSCVSWKQIDVPAEVLIYFPRRNREQFGQAHGTPFTIQPLNDDIGFRGSGDASTSILNCTYDTTRMNQHTAVLNQHLRQTDAMTALDSTPTITEEDYVSKLAVWKESTTTSPSGLHLGHYKALTVRHQYTNVEREAEEDTEEMRNQMEWNHVCWNYILKS